LNSSETRTDDRKRTPVRQRWIKEGMILIKHSLRMERKKKIIISIEMSNMSKKKKRQREMMIMERMIEKMTMMCH
jgi:hypothetical protein